MNGDDEDGGYRPLAQDHWAYHQVPHSQANRWVYVYVRSKVDLEHAYEGLDALAEEYSYRVRTLLPAPSRAPWENGFVLRMETPMRIRDLASKLEPGLSKYDAWAIHDGRREYLESMPGGLLERYFGASSAIDERAARCAQIFVQGRINSTQYVKALDQLRTTLETKGVCLPVFHFADGQILLFGSDESGTITNRRCAKFLQPFSGWAVIDASEGAYSRNGLDDNLWLDCTFASLDWSDIDNG
jgi:hypothetical protein